MNPAAFPEADIWIQAASAGEAFLAVSIIRQLCPPGKIRILVTTTTAQGMDILSQGLFPDPGGAFLDNRVTVNLAYFPFDLPCVAAKVIEQVHPGVMVLLETEIWPALFFQLRQSGIPTLILNARMSQKSFRRYRLTRFLWSALAPDQVLAVSDSDAQRYAGLFPRTRVSTMPNIKFDAIRNTREQETTDSLAGLLPKGAKLSILASLRRQEEEPALKMIDRLLTRYPDQVIALFPRHMHRIPSWKRRLQKKGLRFMLRSALETGSPGPVKRGSILLWDRFGELRSAFCLASAVFVGGSLKPLGGQNFMEPVIQGAPTVIGPFWDDFSWVGQALFDQNIVLKRKDWQDAAQTMVCLLEHPPDRESLRQKAAAYIGSRRGGTELACRTLLESLKNQGTPLHFYGLNAGGTIPLRRPPRPG